MKICIIDVLGLPYNGDTLLKQGLGGSESSVIRISRELVKLGFEVTVFSKMPSDAFNAMAHIDGVCYAYLEKMQTYDESLFKCDIMISSRSVEPFRDNPKFRAFRQHNPHKILWMHDTFIQEGDNDLEEMVVKGFINEIFTLSDFHTVYITNCTHGRRRNFEVLKNKVWMTRNGVEQYQPFIDVKKKEPNLWVFNASYTKGMRPTVEEIWPRIKTNGAQLIVIGGFYRFPNGQADQQEKDWNRLAHQNKDKSIRFTGVIPQKEISDILTRASFFLAPGEFPETFGISALEAIAHNVPVITSRFGALEETAIQGASYMMDYTLKNNALFEVNEAAQLDGFVHMCNYARNEPYIWAQKANACNIVKDIIGWDSVALQWKQHFFRLFDRYMDVEEYQKVKYINHRVHKVFGRRFSNYEDFL